LLVTEDLGVREARELLADLVRIPSVNPRDGQSGAGEGEIGEFVAGWLREAGLEVGMQEALSCRYNVVARLPGRDPGRTLLLESHLDTVEVEGMSVSPFAAEVRNGRLFGRGSCDAKGSLAAFMLALRHLVRRGIEPQMDVVLVAAADEEFKGRGVEHFLDSWNPGRRIAGAVVGLPTQLGLVIAHKGSVRFQIRTLGKGAHTAQPWQGDNAIERMGQVMEFVHKTLAPELARAPHALVGQPTLVSTGIQGGRGGNVVPHECVLTLNRWTVPGEDGETVWARYKVQIEGLAPGKIEVLRPLANNPPMETPMGANVVLALEDILAAHGLDPKAEGGNYGSDAGRLTPRGIPCVLFGPGSISDAHQPNESIELKEVVTAADVVRELAGGFSA
jgi:acetylornithine deacetylase